MLTGVSRQGCLVYEHPLLFWNHIAQQRFIILLFVDWSQVSSIALMFVCLLFVRRFWGCCDEDRRAKCRENRAFNFDLTSASLLTPSELIGAMRRPCSNSALTSAPLLTPSGLIGGMRGPCLQPVHDHSFFFSVHTYHPPKHDEGTNYEQIPAYKSGTDSSS